MFRGWRFIVKDMKHDTTVYVSDYVFENKRHAQREAVLFIEHYYPGAETYGWYVEKD